MIHCHDHRIDDATAVRVITLDARGRANALSIEMMTELRRAIVDAQDRTILLTGAGRSFCGGLDLDEIAATGSVRAHLEAFAAVFGAWAAHTGPIISFINGPSAAGGVGLAVCADVSIARASATFTLPADAVYAPLVTFLEEIVAAFRPDAKLDRLRGARVPVTELSDLVDRLVEADTALDARSVAGRAGLPRRERAAGRWDAARPRVQASIEAAANASSSAALIDSLKRR